MADIRINALATTAASTASDDFVAVDGSANGTRKLNAFSPTFGGDLTVSGAGTHSFAGQVTSTVNAANTSNLGSFVASNATLNSFTSYSPSASLDQKYWTWQSGTAIGDGTIRLRALNDAQNNGINAITVTRSGISSTAVTIGGNLTVIGTGTSSFGGNLSATGEISCNGAGGAFRADSRTGSGINWYIYNPAGTYLSFYNSTSGAVANLTASGNLLLGTTTDSANGKLQLATHTTAAGGIGFGADTTFFRAASGNLCLGDSGTNAALSLYNAGTQRAYLFAQGSTSTFFIGSLSAGWSTAIQSGNGTTALTLDSSQNATFAGSTGVQLKNDSFLYFGSTVRTAVKGNSTGSLELYANNNLSLTLASTGDATFAGTVTLGSITAAATTPQLTSRAYYQAGLLLTNAKTDNAGVRNWAIVTSQDTFGDFQIKQSTTLGGSAVAGTAWMKISETGNATFAGAIAIGNTVNTVSPTSPNRTITMVIGGVTYYLHAKTTND